MQKKKILVDVDDTLCENIFIIKVNAFLGTKYKLKDIKDYFIDDLIPVERRKEYAKFFLEENPYNGIKFFDGAKETLKQLNEKYDIYICSACVMSTAPEMSSMLFAYKYDFLVKNLPFLDPNKFIFTSSKDIINADVIIDDYFHNLRGNIDKKFLFTSTRNEFFTESELAERGAVRVNTWKEIKNLLLND